MYTKVQKLKYQETFLRMLTNHLIYSQQRKSTQSHPTRKMNPSQSAPVSAFNKEKTYLYGKITSLLTETVSLIDTVNTNMVQTSAKSSELTKTKDVWVKTIAQEK